MLRWGLLLTGVMIGVLGFVVGVRADTVRSACQGDYLSHCSHTIPFSSTCRSCMRDVGLHGGLSGACVDALMASGQITKRDIHTYFKKMKIKDVVRKKKS